MSLATRCTSCGTAFRVVQDQLKVSDGWVRCGQCEQVFNAIEGLFDLSREPLASRSPADGEGSTAGAGPVVDADVWNAAGASLLEPAAPFGETDVRAEQPRSRDQGLETAGSGDVASADVGADTSAKGDGNGNAGPRVDEQVGTDAEAIADFNADSGTQSEAHSNVTSAVDPNAAVDVDVDVERTTPFGQRLADERDDAAAVGAGALIATNSADGPARSVEPDAGVDDRPAEDPAAINGAATDAAAQPEFVRSAVRRERWQSGRARAAMALLASFAALGLAAQSAHHFRDLLASRWPVSRPALLQWCKAAGCKLEPARVIDDVAVESAALTQDASSPDAYRLGITLRSRSAIPLGVPSVDLSLTDSEGQLVARRSLSPQDFRAPAVLPPGAELALQLRLAARDARVAGYTVEVFYP